MTYMDRWKTNSFHQINVQIPNWGTECIWLTATKSFECNKCCLQEVESKPSSDKGHNITVPLQNLWLSGCYSWVNFDILFPFLNLFPDEFLFNLFKTNIRTQVSRCTERRVAHGIFLLASSTRPSLATSTVLAGFGQYPNYGLCLHKLPTSLIKLPLMPNQRHTRLAWVYPSAER